MKKKSAIVTSTCNHKNKYINSCEINCLLMGANLNRVTKKNGFDKKSTCNQ